MRSIFLIAVTTLALVNSNLTVVRAESTIQTFKPLFETTSTIQPLQINQSIPDIKPVIDSVIPSVQQTIDAQNDILRKQEEERKAQQEAEAAQRQREELARQQEENNRKLELARQQALAAQTTTTISSGSIEDQIREACNKYGCNTSQLVRVMMCESKGNPKAINKISGASGLFQFMPRTFAANAARVGIKNQDIWNPSQQIEVAAFMFSIGQAVQWTCK